MKAHIITSAGVKMPRLIYGTAWKKEKTLELVKKALKEGFRGIDTACQPKHYTEALVGQALLETYSETAIKREDIFLQTKFTSIGGQDLNQPLPYDPKAPLQTQVFQSFATSQKNLGTNYVDSLVLHSPMESHSDTMTVWRAFEELHAQGNVKQLGISNIYDPQDFKNIWNESKVKPAVVQNRFYSGSHHDSALLPFLRANNVAYQSFWTLTGNPTVINNEGVRAIATRLGVAPEQVFYLFMIQHIGACPLNGTTNEAHMKGDLRLLEGKLQLSSADTTLISSLLSR